MLARGLAAISGLVASDALLVVSNTAGLLAIVFLFKLAREEFGDQLALATTALLIFFPTSVLLSAAYTEPLETAPDRLAFSGLETKALSAGRAACRFRGCRAIDRHYPIARSPLGDVD